jgi:hypothetical protein
VAAGRAEGARLAGRRGNGGGRRHPGRRGSEKDQLPWLEIDVAAERKQIFEETARDEESLYDANMHGVNWPPPDVGTSRCRATSPIQELQPDHGDDWR